MQYSQLIFLAAIAVAFYLLLIRPQQQQAKRQREMIASLEPGDSIVTIGGIFATIISVTDERLRVAVADGSELEIAPRAVSDVVADDAEELPEYEEPDDEMEADSDTVSIEDSPK
jgi:preprotein translocase subunit YajC